MTYSVRMKLGMKRQGNSGQRLTWVDTGLADITDGCALNHVPHGETLDGLVLCDATRAVGATNKSYVATALLVAAIASSLLGLETRIESQCRKVVASTSELTRGHPTHPPTIVVSFRHRSFPNISARCLSNTHHIVRASEVLQEAYEARRRRRCWMRALIDSLPAAS